GVSTLKVRDLLRVTLTRWTSPISLTKTPLEEPTRSAATARAAKCAKASTPPKADMLNAKSLTPQGLETQPPLIPHPLAAIRGCPKQCELTCFTVSARCYLSLQPCH